MPSALRFGAHAAEGGGSAVATVVGGRSEPLDDDWETVEAIVRFDERFEPEALAGVDGFSHARRCSTSSR